MDSLVRLVVPRLSDSLALQTPSRSTGMTVACATRMIPRTNASRPPDELCWMASVHGGGLVKEYACTSVDELLGGSRCTDEAEARAATPTSDPAAVGRGIQVERVLVAAGGLYVVSMMHKICDFHRR